ncbi:MAG: serine O-acetyltransferase EpsC [Caldisericota bacterium]|nr:serine O-acetyltransferase EpsC [Caldisericota bacterium]
MHVVRELFSAIRADLEMFMQNDFSTKSKREIILFSTSFRGLVYYRIYHSLYEKGHKFIAMYLYCQAKRKYGMDIYPMAKIEPGIIIDHGMGVVIGSTAFVGKGTILYHGVTLGSKKIERGKRHPIVGRNVFVGNQASILGSVKVGDNAVIGAHSVVLTDIPPHATVVGIPARVIKIEGKNV